MYIQKQKIRITLIAAFSVGIMLSYPAFSAEQKWELAEAIPIFQLTTCVPANDRERLLFGTAASVIELFNENDANMLDIGAQKFLAQTTYRREGSDHIAVCTPPDTMKRVSQAFTLRNGFGKFRLVEYQLELAAKLNEPSVHIVDAVAASAFNANVQASEIWGFRDIRPFARTVLGSFGLRAAKHGQVAYEQMSLDTSMGTGAAQVAAAAAHPQALPKIEKMMNEILSSVPLNRAISREARNRFYELSWAIYYAGDAGKQHTKPIHKMMQRKVESWAPPFGMIVLPPKRLCNLLVHIEGENSIKEYKFCNDKEPLEQ
jgi:hypothetical protein